MVKLQWRLSSNLSYHVFSMKIPGNLQTNFTIKSPLKYQSPHCLIQSPYNHSGNYIYHIFSIKTLDKLHDFSIFWRKDIFSSVLWQKVAE